MQRLLDTLRLPTIVNTWRQATVSASLVNQAISVIAVPFILLVALTGWFSTSLEQSSQLIWGFHDKNQSIDSTTRALETTLKTIQEATQNNLILNDPKLAVALIEKQFEFQQAVFELHFFSDEPSFVAKWQHLYRSVSTSTPSNDDFAQIWADWYALKEQINSERLHLQQSIDAEIKHQQRLFFLGLAVLIPLIFVIAFTLLVRVKRKLSAIERTAIQLGQGEWQQPIALEGNAELVKLGEKLDQLRVRLCNHQREQDTFLRHVSHELKTPLASITEGASLLKDKLLGELNTKQLRVLQIVDKSSHQLGSLIEDLLLFSTAASLVSSSKKTALHSIMEELERHFMMQTSHQNVALHWYTPKDLQIEISALPLKLALTQIVNNALRFAVSQVDVVVKQTTTTLELCVFDDGQGFNDNCAQLATTPFYRGSENSQEQSHICHSGLGLSISEECCRALGGELLIYPTGSYKTERLSHLGGCVVIQLTKDI